MDTRSFKKQQFVRVLVFDYAIQDVFLCSLFCDVKLETTAQQLCMLLQIQGNTFLVLNRNIVLELSDLLERNCVGRLNNTNSLQKMKPKHNHSWL